jgi:rhamnosyltransferase
LISVIIPVRNGGEDLRRCLEAIHRQDVAEREIEIVVVDSSSTDGSAELARSQGARVHVIPVEEFNHGATRNLGAELAQGETLVFTSQDAVAVDSDWLARLTAPLADERVAGVYGRQLPHPGAAPPERYFLEFLYGPSARVQQAAGFSELTMETTLFSNVNAAVPRELFERFRFIDDIIMSEDQEWASRVLLAGYRLLYEPRAAVRHSHAYTLGSAFRRFFDSGASAERAYLAGGRPAGRVLRRAGWRYARGELGWLWRTGQRRWIPYAILYEGMKYLALQLGARHRRIPLPLKRRFSALPSYWEANRPRA